MQEVSEGSARRAVDAVTTALIESQKAHGAVVPNVKAAEDFAKETVREVIAKQEDGAIGVPVGKPSGLGDLLPPDKLSRGEIGPDSKVINRAIADPEAEILRRKAIEDKRLRTRLNYLGTLPEWEGKLFFAALEGETFAKRLGVHDLNGRMSIVADFVINVVEDSNRFFGDWRLPSIRPLSKIIVS